MKAGGWVLCLLVLLVTDAAALEKPWNPDGTISVPKEPANNLPPGAEAFPARWDLVGTLSVREEYNDNLFFGDDEEGDKVDDFLTTLSPGVELSRMTDRLTLRLTGRLDRRIYMEETDYNATDQSYLASVRYAVSPQLSVAGQAGYTKDSSPDRDLETTGLVQGTSKREQQNYGLSADYLITESMSAALSYAYAKDRSQGEEDDDSESHVVTLLLSGNLGFFIPESRGRLTLSYHRIRESEETDDSYKMMAGFSKDLSETWSFVADAGTRYTRTRYDTEADPGDQDENNWGFVGQTTLSWRGEKTGVGFSLSRDLLPASGRGGATDRTSLGVNVNRQFTAEFSGYLSGSYFRNKSDEAKSSDDETDEDTFSGSAGVRYAFTGDLGLEASYSYSKTKDKTEDTNADRNLFMVRLYARHSFLE